MRTIIEYWCPRKTIQGQKYVKLAYIATLAQLDRILTSSSKQIVSRSVPLNQRIITLKQMSCDMRKPAFLFPTWSDTNQAVQLQKMARCLKFRIKEVEGLNYPCSENKGADKLRSNATFKVP